MSSSSEAQTGYKPSAEAVAILCDRLQRMGVSMSESAARSLLEAVLAIEGPRLDAQARGSVQAALEAIRKAADAALRSLAGAPADPPRRDYELSFPPVSEPATVSAQRRKVSSPRPVPRRQEPETSDEEEPRPVFKRRRGR
jgi:hypothetical protein